MLKHRLAPRTSQKGLAPPSASSMEGGIGLFRFLGEMGDDKVAYYLLILMELILRRNAERITRMFHTPQVLFSSPSSSESYSRYPLRPIQNLALSTLYLTRFFPLLSLSPRSVDSSFFVSVMSTMVMTTPSMTLSSRR